MRMNRRQFSHSAAAAAVAASVAYAPGAWAQGKRPQDGAEFQSLSTRAEVEAPAGKIEVVEFFWYNCPHCNHFEPLLENWVKTLPKDVAFRRVPVAFQDSFVPQQRLYYALEAMGLVDKLQVKVFTAIHVEKVNLSQTDGIVEWVGKQGVDKAKFLQQYNSFSVAAKASRATNLQNAYRIEGVPALGVAGRYITDGTMSGSMERAIEVVNFLVGEVRAKR